MQVNWLLMTALGLTGAVAVWGLIDTAGLAEFAASMVAIQFTSRGWFIMATASFMLITCAVLAVSRFGAIKLGDDDEEPEFSTVSWLTMLFAAGMGVGLLYFGTAEPLTHYLLIVEATSGLEAADRALFVTNFHWGLHAWAIYGLTGLVIAYFAFRRHAPILVGTPITVVLGDHGLPRAIAWVSDLLAIYAIAIGVGGSVAMGVFQVSEGVGVLFGLSEIGPGVTMAIFVALCLAFILPLTVDLGAGMALLSNIAMAIAVALMLFILILGPTFFLMGGIVQSIGEYFGSVLPHGFRTFTFMDEQVNNWFQAWTLTYMVWWLAWAPFVGVFIARISRGRTIREFIIGVVLVPTLFSIFWFGVFGGIGFFASIHTDLPILDVVRDNISGVAFFVLQQFPFAPLTIALVAVAAFLFLVTSVVSAAFVLGMFSVRGEPDPPVKIRLAWGIVLGGLGLVMILSGSLDAVRSIIALAALPFVFIVLLLVVCFLKAIRAENPGAQR